VTDLRFELTCPACPEQYDAFLGDEQVAYLHLRHGHFTVECPDCGGVLVHQARPKGDGEFFDDERAGHLAAAKDAILRHLAAGRADPLAPGVELNRAAQTDALVSPLLSVDFKVVNPRLVERFGLPAYKTEQAAGLDLVACVEEPIVLQPGQSVVVGTGIALDIKNPHWCAKIYPRSGTGTKGLVLGNLVGVIDSDYQGELKLALWNRTAPDSPPLTVNPGDRVAQLVFEPIGRPTLNLVTDFAVATARGAGGFGSTGA